VASFKVITDLVDDIKYFEKQVEYMLNHGWKLVNCSFKDKYQQNSIMYAFLVKD